MNFNEYKRTYESSSLPKSMYFKNDGIELIKDDNWIPFYHTFLNDPLAKSLIQKRIQTNEIIQFESRFGLNTFNTHTIVHEGK